METYKVARATARQGLSVVINEGLAVPSGSWSADAANRDLQVDGVDVGRGRAPTTYMRSWAWTTAPPM